MTKTLCMAAVLAAAAIAAPQANAASPVASGPVGCDLHFSLSGWSVIYKTASGTGTIVCDNGTRIPVKLSAKGGGLTVGKSKIVNGRGRFSGSRAGNDLLGTYAGAEAHAGLSKSSTAQVMTKGDISLSLAGTGEGVDLGIGFGAFTIERR